MAWELKAADDYAWEPPTARADALWRGMSLDERRRVYEAWLGWQHTGSWGALISDHVRAAALLVETAIAIMQVGEQAEHKDRPTQDIEWVGAQRHALAMLRRCNRQVQRASLWWEPVSGRFVPETYTQDDLMAAGGTDHD